MFSKLNCCVLLLFCVFVSQVHAIETVAIQELRLRDLQGDPIKLPESSFTVVCFLGTECPLAKLYGPRLQQLADQFSDRGVACLGVNSNHQDSPAEIDAYLKKYDIRFPVAIDPQQRIADAFEAMRTPQVFVVDRSGHIRYSGRIDDQYQPGVARAEPTKTELRDALDALVLGENVEVPETTGVGCLIARVNRSKSEMKQALPTVTFNRDVAPILNRHCVECHRRGEIGPMELTEFDEVVGWGQMILEVIDQKRMPPWHADPNVGHFSGERILPAEARQTIADWMDQGMHEGKPEDLPEPPRFVDGWHLDSTPDEVLPMRARPFLVPADGVIEYQYFVVDPHFESDVWVRAAQVIPGDASVVHHCIVFVRPPDGQGIDGVGWLGAYVPGQRAIELPSGHARLIPKGSKLVFQMHYTPNGTPTEDLSRVGFWKLDADQVTHQVSTQIAINHEFEIPPGERDYVVDLSRSGFPVEARMLGITPHMHVRGKSFQLQALKADGSLESLLSVPRYDFNWQHWYEFENSVELDQIRSLEMKVTFDNSLSNPVNPAADEYVSWGDQTWEEMAVAFFDVATPRTQSADRRSKQPKVNSQQIAARKRVVDSRVADFFARMDTNSDGVIHREETATVFQRSGFWHFDQNRDGKVDRDEVEAAAAARP